MRRAIVLAIALSVVPLAARIRCPFCDGSGWSVVAARFNFPCNWSCGQCGGCGAYGAKLIVPPKGVVDGFGDAI